MDKDILLVTFIVNDTTLTIENPTPEIIAEIKQQYPEVQLLEEKKPIEPKEKSNVVRKNCLTVLPSGRIKPKN